MADDGERAMVQFALSAPFWRIRHGDPDYDPGDVVFDGAALPIKKWYGPVVEIPTSRGTMEPVSFTRVLQEYEARSTVRAVATAIHQRRHFQAHSGDFLEGEHDDA